MRISCALLILAAAIPASATDGVHIDAGEDGTFTYSEDFTTDRFLTEAFCDGVDASMRGDSDIRLHGKQRHRSIVYRFYGDRAILKASVRVQQMANRRLLGGTNILYISGNGLDWQRIDDTAGQRNRGHHWQKDPLLYQGPSLATTEFWLRIEMDNNSGIKSNFSNFIQQIDVHLDVGPEALGDTNGTDRAKQAWVLTREREGASLISLTTDMPPETRPPVYAEATDGLLLPAHGMSARRALGSTEPYPLAIACFVRTDRPGQRVVARIRIRGTRDSSRHVMLSWDGRPVERWDPASFLEVERVYHAILNAPERHGIHELRIAGQDSGQVNVVGIDLAAEGALSWSSKPALPKGGRLDVVSATYEPDSRPPEASQAVEGRHRQQEAGLIHHHLQRFYTEHTDFGSCRVVLRNAGDAPVVIADEPILNGRPVAEHYVDFKTSSWDARGVVWSRVRPRWVPPGKTTEVYLRFRRRPTGENLTLVIPLENRASVELKVPAETPSAAVDYVVTRHNMVYVYARTGDADRQPRVTHLLLDGLPVEQARIYGADFPGGIALGTAVLDAPLKQGSYHTAGVRLADGTQVSRQFRVLPFVFVRSAIHIPPEKCTALHMNTHMWFAAPLDACEQNGIHTTSRHILDQHERVAFIIGPDEPDAHDNRGGGYDKGLGYHARRLTHVGWQSLIQRFAPQASSWIIMNGTTRPLNWAVYAQLADVACFDPYPINFYGGDHTMVRETLAYARRCGAPRPLFACLEAFGFSKGQGVPSKRRAPTPAEWRQNVVQAIGCGMKGLTSWTWVRIAGGFELSPDMQHEIAACNRLLQHIEDDLLLATPIEGAGTDAGTVMTGVVGNEAWPKQRVWAGALLAGPDTLIVAVANHIPASKPENPDIVPADNVTVTVELPDYLVAVEGFEATEDGLAVYPVQIRDGVARLHLTAIESGRVFLLRRK